MSTPWLPLRARQHFDRWVRPHLTPLNLAIAAALGVISAVFTVVIALLILVSTNFNLLGWME